MDYTIHEVQALEGKVAVLEAANARQGVTIGQQAKTIEGHEEVVFAYHERWSAANQRANELEERALQAEAERDALKERVATLLLGYEPIKSVADAFCDSKWPNMNKDELEQMVMTLAFGCRFAFEFGDVWQREPDAGGGGGDA